MMPDAKFLRINGKNINTGIMDIIMAAYDMVLGEIRSMSSGGIPSVMVDV
jgi:hypothetical protein